MVSKITAIGLLGLLVGFAVVAFLQPTTGAGATLVIILCVAAVSVLNLLIGWVRKSKAARQ